MKSISVFCGSSEGRGDAYLKAAGQLGTALAQQNIKLIYGGAKVGLMGAVANAVMDGGGAVTGVIPRFLKTKEVAHEGLTELIQVESMHERKTLMYELSEGVIALPGGFGTLEEFFEMLTWAQLGLHKKPIGILNINGFYDTLIALIQTMYNQQFIQGKHLQLVLVSDNIQDLLQQMNNYQAPEMKKWMDEDEV